jgi:hypothetical protein
MRCPGAAAGPLTSAPAAPPMAAPARPRHHGGCGPELNLLGEAVRDPVLNYGEFVGTLLGTIYACPFPGTTGRVILDRNIRRRGLDQDRDGLRSWLRVGRDAAKRGPERNGRLRVCTLFRVHYGHGG